MVITHNDPVRLNACLWAIALQTTPPDSITVANSGAWVSSELGGTLDIISEFVDVRVKRIANESLGQVHADALALADAERVWLFQDDAVPTPRCLEVLSGVVGQVQQQTSLCPSIVYPDFSPMAGEADELPHEYSRAPKEVGLPKRLTRGPCLGILMPSGTADKVARAVRRLPMALDDAIVQVASPLWVPRALVYHTRPEKPRWNRIVQLVKQEVLPRVG